MTTELETIIARIEADTSDLRKELQRTGQNFDQFSRTTERHMGKVDRSVQDLTSGFKGARRVLAGFAAAWATFASGRATVGIVSQFEDLEDSLSVVFGSLENGQAAMERILQTAAQTPFSIQRMTQAYITLRASGIEPTEQLMRTFSDTASVTTDRIQTFEALVRVAARSVGGGLGLEELNQIADRGIPVWRILEEELGKNRLQLSEVGKTAAGAQRIMDALIRGLDREFGGATERALDNMSVATSNFTDAMSALINEISKFTGAGNFFTSMVNQAAENMNRWRAELKLLSQEGLDALLTLQRTTETIEEYDEALQKATEVEIRNTETKKANVEATSELQEQVAAASKELEFELQQLSRSETEQRLYNMAIQEGVEDVEAYVEALRPLVMAIDEKIKFQEREIEVQKMLDEEHERLVDSQKKTIDQFMDLRDSMLTAEERYEQTTVEIAKLRAEMEALGVQGEEIDKIFDRAMEDAQDTLEESQQAFLDTGQVLQSVGQTFSSAFEDAIIQGDKFSDILEGLADDLLRIAVRQMILGPITGAIFGQGGFLPGLMASKRGNVFSGPVTPFVRGGVTRGPIAFPMATGTGIAGEAGEEAIMPLQRGPNGNLGVAMYGGSGRGYMTQVNVYAPPGSSVQTDRQETANGERIDLLIDNANAQNIRRPGSKTHQALKSTFGIQQTVVTR